VCSIHTGSTIPYARGVFCGAIPRCPAAPVCGSQERPLLTASRWRRGRAGDALSDYRAAAGLKAVSINDILMQSLARVRIDALDGASAGAGRAGCVKGRTRLSSDAAAGVRRPLRGRTPGDNHTLVREPPRWLGRAERGTR
jgi:hypothetical protein